MATLVPRFAHTEPIKLGDRLLAQLLDIAAPGPLPPPEIQREEPEFVSSGVARVYADRLSHLLDNDKLVIGRFTTNYPSPGDIAYIIASTESSKAHIERTINDMKRRHFYFGSGQNTVRASDINIEPLPKHAEEYIIETVAFMYTSRGFWIIW